MKKNPSKQRVNAEVHDPIYPLFYYNDLSTRQDKYVQTKWSQIRLLLMGRPCMDPEGDRGSGHPNHKNIGFLNNGPDPLNKHKATKPTFNVGPSLALKWRSAGGPMMARF